MIVSMHILHSEISEYLPVSDIMHTMEVTIFPNFISYLTNHNKSACSLVSAMVAIAIVSVGNYTTSIQYITNKMQP